MHIARFGNIAIATNPFELFLDYGNQIRARSRARQTIIIQLACGDEGYLPTEKAVIIPLMFQAAEYGIRAANSWFV